MLSGIWLYLYNSPNNVVGKHPGNNLKKIRNLHTRVWHFNIKEGCRKEQYSRKIKSAVKVLICFTTSHHSSWGTNFITTILLIMKSEFLVGSVGFAKTFKWFHSQPSIPQRLLILLFTQRLSQLWKVKPSFQISSSLKFLVTWDINIESPNYKCIRNIDCQLSS